MRLSGSDSKSWKAPSEGPEGSNLERFGHFGHGTTFKVAHCKLAMPCKK